MATYGSELVKWRVGPLVWLDRAKFPGVTSSNQYPYGFFGLWRNLAIQYDYTEIL